MLWTKELFVCGLLFASQEHSRMPKRELCSTSGLVWFPAALSSHCRDGYTIQVYVALSHTDFIASLGGLVGSTPHDKACNDWLV